MFQLFQFSTSEKRSNSACYGCRCSGGCLPELVCAYLQFYLSEFLPGKIYLLFRMPFCSVYVLQFSFLLLNDKIVSFQMLFTSNCL